MEPAERDPLPSTCVATESTGLPSTCVATESPRVSFPLISMVRNVGIVAPLMLSGGVVRNGAVRAMIAEAASEDVVLPSQPQLMGAYGAALLGGIA